MPDMLFVFFYSRIDMGICVKILGILPDKQQLIIN